MWQLTATDLAMEYAEFMGNGTMGSGMVWYGSAN